MRIDIHDGQEGGCHTVWTNSERVPNLVIKISLETGLIYTYTKDPSPDRQMLGISRRSTSARVRRPSSGCQAPALAMTVFMQVSTLVPTALPTSEPRQAL